MNKLISSLSVAALFAAAAPAMAAEPVELWRTTGFTAPESVSYDPGTDAFYVTNVNGDAEGAAGFISKLNRDGTIAEERFAEGLTRPLGTAIADGVLYVATVNSIATVDLASGEFTQFPAPEGTNMLNGIDVAEDGTVYATDTMAGSIYALQDGTVSLWLQDPALAGINGIEVDGERLIIVRMGDLSNGFANISPIGDAKQINIASKEISDFGQTEIGIFDGVDMAEGGVLAADYAGGKLVFIPEEGAPETILDTGMLSFADHHYYPELDGLVIVPVTQSNVVIAYSWQQ
ncbi:SMP-30/gluconolactonase/LRE family protein [Ketogulonicigenium vulgare]|uniref:SMP-30/gluconolactonase/LRE family protein n=1 Tax=Ketogulonicigenium vulgare TaxID=92945 RepID=UPI002358CCAE|nr:gluconolaconase [Ketogulonicigenium vulgare]